MITLVPCFFSQYESQPIKQELFFLRYIGKIVDDLFELFKNLDTSTEFRFL